jgi:enoyl-CoA hydratase/carnithine racemase
MSSGDGTAIPSIGATAYLCPAASSTTTAELSRSAAPAEARMRERLAITHLPYPPPATSNPTSPADTLEPMTLRSAREGRVLRLTIARIDKRNALNLELCRSLVDALSAANADPHTGAVLLEAEGKVFCAGMDLDDATATDAPARTKIHEHLFTFHTWMRKPVVAAVQGPALAGGLGLVANAHVAVAAQGCTMGLTEVRLGMWPFVVYRSIVAAVGPRRALEISLTGRIFGCNEAREYGLVHEVVPPIELDDRATALAELLAGWSPDTIRRGLEFVQHSREMGHEDAGRVAAMMRSENFASPDFAEGVKAFQEKRPALWPSLPR